MMVPESSVDLSCHHIMVFQPSLSTEYQHLFFAVTFLQNVRHGVWYATATKTAKTVNAVSQGITGTTTNAQVSNRQ